MEGFFVFYCHLINRFSKREITPYIRAERNARISTDKSTLLIWNTWAYKEINPKKVYNMSKIFRETKHLLHVSDGKTSFS